ncbi:MAG: hypothetical protein AABX23_04515 [Nanoarchaeota archaeon]
MTTKNTIRNSDRSKLNKHKKTILEHYLSSFNSEHFCNRCKKVLPLPELEIHHLSYETESYRYGEIVCRPCHEATEKGIISSFHEQKNTGIQNVFVFQKYLSGMAIISRLEDGRILQRMRLRLRAGEEVKPLVLMGIFTDRKI